MTQPNLVQLARSGDANAIAALMNATLQAIDITARVTWQATNLYVLLESDRVVAEQSAIEFVRQGMTQLGVSWLSSAVIYSRRLGESAPTWVQKIDFDARAIANPFGSQPPAHLDVEENLQLPLWHRPRLFNLLLLTLPLVALLNVGHIWQRYLMGVSNVGVLQATSRLSDRRSASLSVAPTVNADPFKAALRQASRAVVRGQSATSRTEWHQVAAGWWQAIVLLKQVPADHPQAAIARQKAIDYQRNLDYLAKDRLSTADGMTLKKVIAGAISPASIAYNNDRFFAQTRTHGYTMTVYDRNYNPVQTIVDRAKAFDVDHPQAQGLPQGTPADAAFTQDGDVWVPNYHLSSHLPEAGFKHTADKTCSPAENHEPGVVSRLKSPSLRSDRGVQVGAVPTFLAASPDSRFVLVSNWCSWDVSVIEPQQNREVHRLQVGPYPRGIAIDARSKTAYVAVMGAHNIAAIDLHDFSVSWLKNVGRSPYHLSLSTDGSILYATLKGESTVAKIDLRQRKVIGKVSTCAAPRSMTLSSDGEFVYVVNDTANTVSKIRTMDMAVVQTVKVDSAPIGITYDPKTHQVWVACDSGNILVFQD